MKSLTLQDIDELTGADIDNSAVKAALKSTVENAIDLRDELIRVVTERDRLLAALKNLRRILRENNSVEVDDALDLIHAALATGADEPRPPGRVRGRVMEVDDE